MIKLEIMNHSGSCINGRYYWINHSCIRMVGQTETNIAGVKFVRIIFTPDLMKSLHTDCNGSVFVKGTIEEILGAISEAKGGVK